MEKVEIGGRKGASDLDTDLNTDLTLVVDGLFRLDEDGHRALREREHRLVEERSAAQRPVRVALHSEPVLAWHRRARYLN